MPPALPTVCVVNKSRWGSHSLEEGWETSASLLLGKHQCVIPAFAAVNQPRRTASRKHFDPHRGSITGWRWCRSSPGSSAIAPLKMQQEAIFGEHKERGQQRFKNNSLKDPFTVWELLGHVSRSGRLLRSQRCSNIWLMDTPWSVFVHFVH